MLVIVFTHLSYYVHATEDMTYTVTQLNLVKLFKEPSATYHVHIWPQGGKKINILIPLHSPP